jgi:hypothetical protein
MSHAFFSASKYEPELNFRAKKIWMYPECRLKFNLNCWTLFFNGLERKKHQIPIFMYVCSFETTVKIDTTIYINRNTVPTVHRTVVSILNEHTAYNHLELHVPTVTFTVLLLSQRRRRRGSASVCLACNTQLTDFYTSP